MSKRLGLLIVMMLFVTMMTGCFGSDDSTTPTPATTSSVVITGTIPALSAPAGAPNKMVNYGTNYEMGVFNAATMTEITGSAVVINGTTYTATVPAGAANVTALIVIRHKTTGKVVYSAIAGNLPTTTQMSAASVTKVTVSGVNLNGESTALATIAKDKGVAAPSIPVSTSVTTMPATVKSTIDTAVGTATITAIRDAVEAVQTVLNASSVPETVKSSILSALDAALSNVLNAFVTAVKDASAVITSAGGATTVTVGGTTINSTTTPAQVTDAVNHVTVVTVSAVTNPSDIAVANGTAVSAIQFPTTVTVTLSNGQTATKNVVWSTTSTPAYNATVSGTYAFTGTVDGTTLKATVKVNVGIIQLKVATPTFTPAAGTFTAAQSVTIATATEGATIYYTTDGTEPTTSSSVYASAINVAATTTIKAIATKTGMTTSDVASALYTINISLIPVISAERAVKQANGDIVVTWTTNIVTPTAAKLIVSGDIPNPSYPSVLETVSTTTSHSVTIPAAKLAENSAYTKLVISYVIGEDGTTASIAKSAIIEATQVVADPVFAPVAGTYTTAQSVTLTCATEGAEIYYTTDGSTPNSLSTKYTGAIALSTSATTNFKAIAVKTGMTDSNVVSATYVLNISTTKVLTGIALAKATDTVEAETAYTLPTAKASYDDNSVPADVTVSWVEVLAGGTSAVTLPVTKTTAGTYNFQASYTENGVTKTADFVLVVTEKVPVKTLQSITVTADPAAPTCLLGKTAEITLVVTANFINPTTSEVVTTYTTGTNYVPATKVFTPATTVAGTENIVVSYTFDGTTKTFDVPVTVTAEAPVASTVEVTLPSTLTEATSTAAVVIVKDQFGAAMTTGFTTAYAVTTGTSTVTTAGLVTAGAYSSTAANNAHVLTVTVTPTGKPALVKTANFTVTADATKPALLSVTATNAKTIVATFSKKLADSALDTSVATYKLVNSQIGSTATLVTGATAADQIQVLPAFTDTTKTAIKFYIVSVNASLNTSYPVGGLDAVNYRFYVASGVVDTAATPNSVVANSNIQFMGTTTPDTVAPALISASYDTSTGVLNTKFDKKPAIVTSGDLYYIVNGTNTVQLTGINGALGSDNLSLDFTLSAALKTSLGSELTGAIARVGVGGVKDASNNANTATMETSLTATIHPYVTVAAYDVASRTLNLTFNTTIKTSTIDNTTEMSNFKLKLNSTQTVTLGASDTITTTSNSNTIAIVLSVANNQTIAQATTATPKFIVNAANFYTDTNNVNNIIQDDVTNPAVTLAITADTTKPVVQSITYKESTKKLVFTFNVAVSKTIANHTDVKLYETGNTSSTAAFTTNVVPTETSDTTTLTFDLSAGDGAAVATAMRTSQQAVKTMYFQFAANTFTKSGGSLGNDAVTASAAATMVAYTDDVAPTAAPVVVDNNVSLTVTFSEKMDTVSAGLKSNYTITTSAAPYTPLTVEKVTVTDLTTTMKTVNIVTASQTAGTGNYVLTISSNVKDMSGNGITAGTLSFNGTAASPAAPALQSASIVDVNANGTLDVNDKIKLTFDAPMSINTAKAPNLFLDIAGDKAKFDSSVNGDLAVDSTDSKIVYVTISNTTLKNAITVGTSTIGYTLVGVDGGLLRHYYANTVQAATGSQTITSPSGTPAVSTAVLTDVNTNGRIDKGDTLVMTFSSKLLKADATDLLTLITVKRDDNNGGAIDAGDTALTNADFGTGATVTTTMTTTTSSDTVTLTFGESPNALFTPTMLRDATGGKAIAYIGTSDKLKDSWNIGLANTATKVITTTASTTAPYITKVLWVDMNGDSKLTGAAPSDYLYVTFSAPVWANLAGVTAAANWNKGTLVLGNAVAAVEYVANDATTIRLKVAGAEDTSFVPNVATFELDKTLAAITTGITNFAGVAVTAASTANKVTTLAATDTTPPTIVSAKFLSDSKISVLFSEPVIVDALANSKLQVVGSTTKDIGIDVAPPALDPADTTNKTAIFTVKAASSPFGVLDQQNGVPSSGVASATAGLKVVDAASGIKDLAGNALQGTATGANYTVIAKDTTAPDAAKLLTTTVLARLAYSNSSLLVTVNNSPASPIVTDFESCQLQVYMGASAPAVTATPNGSSAYYTTAGVTNNATAITLTTATTSGYGIYYRLVDQNSNASAWVQNGSVLATALPDGTYKVVAAKPTAVAGAGIEAFLTSNTLTVATTTAVTDYDVTGNATVKSIMAALEATDTFTVASGKVSAIDDSVVAGGAANSIALLTADCAATLTVAADTTAAATNKLTLTGTATAVTLTKGEIDVSGLTATLNVAAAGTTTVTATGKTLTSVAGAQIINVNGAATVNVTAAVTTLNITGDITTALNIGSASNAAAFTVGNLNIGKATAGAACTVAALNVIGASGKVSTVTALRVGHDTQNAAVAVTTLTVGAYGTLTGLTITGNSTATGAANTATVGTLTATDANAVLSSMTVGLAHATNGMGVITNALAAGTIKAATNVTVLQSGTLSGAVAIPTAYAGTWVSTTSANIGAVTIGGDLGIGGSLTFKGVAAGAVAPTFTITGVTGPANTAIPNAATAGSIAISGAGVVTVTAGTGGVVTNATDTTGALTGAANTKVTVTNTGGAGAGDGSITQIAVTRI